MDNQDNCSYSDTTPPLSSSVVSSIESSPMSSGFLVKHSILRDAQPEEFASEELQLKSSPVEPPACGGSPSPPKSKEGHRPSRSASRSRCNSQSESSHTSHSRPQSVREHTLEQHARTFPRYRPRSYMRSGPTPLELRFAARMTGPAAHISVMLEEVEEAKDILLAALDHFPQDVLQKAYEAKRADRDTVIHRVAQTAAEIESLERHRVFLSAIKSHQETELAVENSMLDIVRATLTPRSLEDVEDDSGYYRAVFADELVALTTADALSGQVGQAVELAHA